MTHPTDETGEPVPRELLDRPARAEVSEADTAGRLDDDPSAQPELTEAELAPESAGLPRLDEADLAPDDLPEDS